MHPYNVIIKPIISEKSNDLREAGNQVSFLVRREAKKADIRKAVVKLWDVKVESVNTMIKRDKIKRRGANLSKPGKSKKAVVTLAKGEKLPIFEDQ